MAATPEIVGSRTRYVPQRPRLWADGAVAAGLVLLLAVPTASFLPPGDLLRQTGIAVITLAMPIAAIWRASNPVASAAAIYALALAHFIALPTPLPIDFVIFLALYSVTVHGPRWAERTALGSAVFGAMLATYAVNVDYFSRSILVDIVMMFGFICLLITLAWGAGLLRRSRSAQTESLRDRAARLEFERDQQRELATAAERTRIAREMHDIVAHSLSVVIAQADGGSYALANSPETAGLALETIAETGRAALADMRRTLGVLRDDDAAANETLTPAPSELNLESLIEHIRGAGVPVSHITIGEPVSLPPGTTVAVYRITQESLTNVLKHGGPDVRATVLTEWRLGELRLSITDDGRGAAATTDGRGHGLIGMRERANMLGGTLTAGPRTSGGFQVEARIPTNGGTPATIVPPTTITS